MGYTYVVVTKAPRGPRSFTTETFVVSTQQYSHTDAVELALKSAHPDAQVLWIADVKNGAARRVAVS